MAINNKHSLSEGSLAGSQCNKSPICKLSPRKKIPWTLISNTVFFACYIPKRIGIVLVGFLVFFALASFLLARKMWAKPRARERLLQGQNWIPHASHALPANLDLSPAGTQSRVIDLTVDYKCFFRSFLLCFFCSCAK